jgi:hypothetical protein
MSGTGKSDVLREFRVPIDEMEDALIKDHNKKSARLETELRCLEIDIKELEKKCKKGAAPDLKEEMGSLLLKKKECLIWPVFRLGYFWTIPRPNE